MLLLTKRHDFSLNFGARNGIITGGTGALGRAVTEAFVKAGAKLAVTYVVDEEVPLLKQRLGRDMKRVSLHKVDLFDETAVRGFVKHALKRLDRIDFLINLVGGYHGGTTIAETEEKEWENMMRLNLRPTFLCCKVVLPYMAKQRYGRIVSVSSESGLKGESTLGAYSASKSGVLRLTETIADEYRGRHITANAILPRIIDTPSNRQAMPDADFSKWPKPEEIANVIIFLASDDAKLINGAAIPVYGLA